MKCVPGTPCYKGDEVMVYTTYPRGYTSSQSSPFSLPLSSDNIYYSGPNLPYTGIQTEDDLTTALQRIDALFNSEEIFDLFMQAINNNPTLKSQLCTAIGTCP